MRRWELYSVVLLSALISSCTRVPQGGEDQIAGLVQERIDKDVYWNKECYEDPRIQAYLQNLIAQPLSAESVVQIALLNNPEIQAIFEELGIAQADLVEAGLLSNPAFEIEVRYPPPRKRLVANIEYLVTATFLDIFLVPLRTRVAEAELEQVKLRVTNDILDLAFEVRQTYYELLAEQQQLQYTQSIVELTSIHNEIVSRQHIVSNVNQLDFQQIQARFLEAKLEIAKQQSEIIRLREKLNRLLGLDQDICLILPDIQEEIDYQGFDLCALESIALQERLDLQAARFDVVRLRRMLRLKDLWTYTNLQTGLAGERDDDGMNKVGYGISGEVPIFNYGQAARMRLFAQLRQLQDRLSTLEIRILSEVREAHKLLMNNLGMIIDYRQGIIPVQKRILQSSEELYNVMGLGIDRLLENKRQELEAYRNYLEVLKDYWVARVQLDRALGGYLFRVLPQNDCIEGPVE